MAGLRIGLAPLPVAGVSVDSSSPGWFPQEASLWPRTHRHPPAPFPLIGRQSLRSFMGVSPRSLDPDRGDDGETTAGPARGIGAVSEGIAGGLILVIWRPHYKDFSASHWHPGTSVTEDSRRLGCAKSLLGVQIRIPGSDGVRSPWCMGVLRQFSTNSCTSASSSACSKTDLPPLPFCATYLLDTSRRPGS